MNEKSNILPNTALLWQYRDLVRNLTMVSNTSSNMARYHVRIGGGTGVCADSFLIFDESNAGNPDVFKRGFAVALTALATGMPVDVWSYGPDDCRSPAGIWIGE